MIISELIDEIMEKEPLVFEGPDGRIRTNIYRKTNLENVSELIDLDDKDKNLDCIIQILLNLDQNKEFDKEKFSTYVSMLKANMNDIKYENENELFFILESENPFNFWSKDFLYPLSSNKLKSYISGYKERFPSDWEYRIIPLSKLDVWLKFHPCKQLYKTEKYDDLYRSELTEDEIKSIKKYEVKLYDFEV